MEHQIQYQIGDLWRLIDKTELRDAAAAGELEVVDEWRIAPDALKDLEPGMQRRIAFVMGRIDALKLLAKAVEADQPIGVAGLFAFTDWDESQ